MNESESHPINHLGQPVGFDMSSWQPPPFPERQMMEGRFCRLEALDLAAHATALYAAFASDENGANWTYLPYGPFCTVEDFSEWVELSASAVDPQFYAVISKETDQPVGVLSYLRIQPDAGSIEVGHLHFSESVKKSPVSTEALFLMMSRAFDLGYRRYEWRCDSLNAPSYSAALRLGLSFEGVFRQATVYKNRNRDTAWFAAIDSQWPALKAAFLKWLDPENFDENGRQRCSLRDLTRPLLTGN